MESAVSNRIRRRPTNVFTTPCLVVQKDRMLQPSDRYFPSGVIRKGLALLVVMDWASSLVLADSDVKSSAPTVSWHKSYNGSGEESHPHYVVQTSDLGFLMVGETGFVDDRSAKIFLVKTDWLGNLLWQKEFGKRGYNLGNCVCEADDGNYLVAGTLDMDAALIKVHAKTGKTIWSKTWNLGTEDSFEGVCLSPDGGILVTGYRSGLAEGTFLNWGRGVLLKTDASGNEQWKRDLSKYTCSGYRIQPKGENFLISCHPRDEESTEYNLLLVDASGKIEWARNYGEIYWGFDQSTDGKILLAGHTRNTPLSENLDIQFLVLDQHGRTRAREFFGQPRGYDGRWIHDEVWGARATSDGGWLAVAGTGDETNRYEGRGHRSGPSGQWKIYLIKTDGRGRLEWEGVYGSKEMDWAGEDVCMTADGGALVANDCGAFGFTKIKPFLN